MKEAKGTSFMKKFAAGVVVGLALYEPLNRGLWRVFNHTPYSWWCPYCPKVIHSFTSQAHEKSIAKHKSAIHPYYS